VRTVQALRGALVLLFALVALAPSPLSVADELRGLRLRSLVSSAATPQLDRPVSEAAVVETDAVAAVEDASPRGEDTLAGESSADLNARVGPPSRAPAGDERTSFAPTRLVIDAIGVDAPVTPVGLTPWGAMAAPAESAQVGWFTDGATPGAIGRAVLAGHRDTVDGPAVFFDLGRLQRGDEIAVFARDGALQLNYIVYAIEQYQLEDAPVERIFGSNGSADLALITCTGDFSWTSGYSARVVVYARLVQPS